MKTSLHLIVAVVFASLFAARIMGYTLNRVSLFALIFSIGILVDDAIVIIESIARHWAMRDGRPVVKAAVDAVAEVGNPSVSSGTRLPVLEALFAASGPATPSMAPWPNSSGCAESFFSVA